MSLQRYVSPELTHFVARQAPTDDERYNILIKVLRDGLLAPRPDRPTDTTLYEVDLGHTVSGNEMFLPRVVCFCDIPVEDLALHMAKYSRFGLAFEKAFLIRQGANPVFYIANNSTVAPLDSAEIAVLREASALLPGGAKELKEPLTRAEYFDVLVELHQRVSDLVTYVLMTPGLASRLHPYLPSVGEFDSIRLFIEMHLFNFFKFFDGELAEGDARNYYMEREWRVVGNVRFTLNDVARAIFPAAFAERFRGDVPDYFGPTKFV